MSKRQITQLIFFVITIAGGIRFYFYISDLQNGVPAGAKPGLVEGFLPISALMSFKRFVLTGVYDYVHPAGLTLFIFILLVSLIFKKELLQLHMPCWFCFGESLLS